MEKELKRYEDIRKEFPEVISKEQFRKISHISKATALYLLESGLVPCKKLDQRTHRYRIRTDDVIVYMIEREHCAEKYRAESNWYKNRSHRKTCLFDSSALSSDKQIEFREYIEESLQEYEDLVSTNDVINILGYSKSIVNKWCRTKTIKAFCVSRKFLIPKVELINFLISPYSFNIKRKTWKHILLIKGFFNRI